MQEGLAEVNSWTDAGPGGCDTADMQGAARAAFSFGQESIDVYRHIPLLAAKLDSPGVRDECLRQFAAAELADHDPVSVQLFGEQEGSFRDMVSLAM